MGVEARGARATSGVWDGLGVSGPLEEVDKERDRRSSKLFLNDDDPLLDGGVGDGVVVGGVGDIAPNENVEPESELDCGGVIGGVLR